MGLFFNNGPLKTMFFSTILQHFCYRFGWTSAIWHNSFPIGASILCLWSSYSYLRWQIDGKVPFGLITTLEDFGKIQFKLKRLWIFCWKIKNPVQVIYAFCLLPGCTLINLLVEVTFLHQLHHWNGEQFYIEEMLIFLVLLCIILLSLWVIICFYMCSQFVIRMHVACIKVLCIYMLDPMRLFCTSWFSF